MKCTGKANTAPTRSCPARTQVAIHRLRNMTKMVSPLGGSRVPKLWGEDHLLPRHARRQRLHGWCPGPGGCIYKVDPDGKNWELVRTGTAIPRRRFNRYGDLFTYDADMEWDMNTPCIGRRASAW